MNARCQSARKWPKEKFLSLLISSMFVSTIGLLVTLPDQTHAADATVVTQKNYTIGAGALSDVLAQFAVAANVPLSFNPALLANIASPGLQGSYTVSAGFARLLNGTGYAVEHQGENTYALRKIPQKEVSGNDRALPTLTVQAGAMATTEGSGSYTTGSMNTATKMALSIRETPQSVSVITRQRMDDQGVETLTDALQQTTGVKIQKAEVFGNAIEIRGFAVDTIQIDGMPVTRLGETDPGIDLAVYDRVEVLRGAAGVLQGAGTPGGTVNMVRKMPTRDFSAKAFAHAGSWSNYRVEGDISTPLNADGSLRTRLIAAIQDQGSFIDYVKERKEVFYGVVQYDVTPSLTATLGLDYQHTDGVPQGTGMVFYLDGGDIGLPRSTYLGASWNSRKTDTTNLFGDLAWKLGGGWTAKLAGSYQWYDSDRVFLSASGSGVDRTTGLGPKLNYANASNTDNTQSGVDLYASGPFTLLGRQHELVIGANARRANNKALWAPVKGYDTIFPDVKNWNPSALAAPTIGAYEDLTQTTTKQSGIYSTAKLKLADPLTLMLGARVSWWDYDSKATDLTNGQVTTTAYSVSRQVTPYAGVVFDLNEQFSLYASYTDIFKPQNAIDRYGKLLDPIVGANYEAGIKGEFMDGRLNSSLAVFRIDQSNRAITDLDGPKPCPFTKSDYCSIAEGKVRSEGIELDVSGEIAPGWQLYAGHTFNTTKYVKDRSNEGKQFNTRTPKHMTKFFTSYRLPGELNKLTIGGGFTWQSDFQYSNTKGTINIRQGAYAVANAMARYQITPKISATLNINNLFDKTYYRYIAHERAYNYYGEPRSFMLSLRAQFD